MVDAIRVLVSGCKETEHTYMEDANHAPDIRLAAHDIIKSLTTLR